jgi:dTDP-4-dehydrorhamnose 3,5-epimerase
MEFVNTPIEGLYEIHPERKGDERGWFMRTYDISVIQNHYPNFDGVWKQMNHSFNAQKHTWRGFHYQNLPYQEIKIVRCIRGKVLDCVVDLRTNASTYLKTYQIELSALNAVSLLIPKGLAHGFLTLEDNTELIYLHDEFYKPEFEGGVRYNDPKINIKLPFIPQNISQRDLNHKNI